MSASSRAMTRSRMPCKHAWAAARSRSATALDVLERLLVAETPAAVGVLELDWPALARFLPSAHSPRFREVAREGSRGSEEEGGAELQRWLRELPPAELRVAVDRPAQGGSGRNPPPRAGKDR